MLHEVLEAYIGGERYPNMQPVTDVSDKDAKTRFETAVHGEANRIDPRHKEIAAGITGGVLYIKYDDKPLPLTDLKKKK
jgi:hypothetical protein